MSGIEYTMYIVLKFSVTDTELAQDFIQSPVLLPSEGAIKKAYKESFGFELTDVDYKIDSVFSPIAPSWTPGPAAKAVVPGPHTAPGAPGGYPPKKYGKIRNPEAPCTDAQVSALYKMYRDRDIEIDGIKDSAIFTMLMEYAKTGEALPAGARITKGEASKYFDKWGTAPFKKSKGTSSGPTSKDIPPGFYKSGTSYYQVKERKDKSGVYAMKMTATPGGEHKYLYEPHYIHDMVREGYAPIGEAERKTFAKSTTCCVYCGRKLEDALSVDRGVGPKCYARYVAKKH